MTLEQVEALKILNRASLSFLSRLGDPYMEISAATQKRYWDAHARCIALGLTELQIKASTLEKGRK